MNQLPHEAKANQLNNNKNVTAFILSFSCQGFWEKIIE